MNINILNYFKKTLSFIIKNINIIIIDKNIYYIIYKIKKTRIFNIY